MAENLNDDLSELENMSLIGLSRKAYRLHLEIMAEVADIQAIAAAEPHYVLAVA